jgi:hypothetical protein
MASELIQFVLKLLGSGSMGIGGVSRTLGKYTVHLSHSRARAAHTAARVLLLPSLPGSSLILKRSLLFLTNLVL